MTAQTWDRALARAAGWQAEGNERLGSYATANLAVLTQLRERWQDSVDVVTSMFDLVMVPSGAAWPSDGDGVFVRMDHDERAGEPVVRVVLYRTVSRASLPKPGGTAIVAGDICKIGTAPAVVEAFLYQIARSASAADTGQLA